MPFLRLTRDRRGFENTFLMHADRPGDRPRLLYWYRTAPGIMLGRSPLDEDAIRTIEEQHPDIDFDWPAILALSEVMTPEDEAPAPRPQHAAARQPRRAERPREHASRPPATIAPPDGQSEPPMLEQAETRSDATIARRAIAEIVEARPEASSAPSPKSRRRRRTSRAARGVGRPRDRDALARALRRNHRAHSRAGWRCATRDAWMKRAEALNPDMWLTPEAMLEGVRSADDLFESAARDST